MYTVHVYVVDRADLIVVIGLGDSRLFPSPVVDTDGMILPPTRVFDEVSRKLCSHPTPLSSVYSRIFSSYFAAFCLIGCCAASAVAASAAAAAVAASSSSVVRQQRGEAAAVTAGRSPT